MLNGSQTVLVCSWVCSRGRAQECAGDVDTMGADVSCMGAFADPLSVLSSRQGLKL